MVAGKAVSRPQTPRDSALIKTVRYEEASASTPPIQLQQTPPKSTTTPTTTSPTLRPRTAPSRAGHRVSHFSEDVKRDSGFASSPLSQQSFAQSAQAPPIPSLPAYITQEERTPFANGGTPEKQWPLTATIGNAGSEKAGEDRRRSSFVRRRSKKSIKNTRSVSPPKRLESFKGIQTDIPTSDLGDLTSNNFGFSNRGSILFGGKKMNELFAAISAGDESMVPTGVPTAPVEPLHDTPPVSPRLVEGVAGDNTETNTPATALVAGRRKPSVHMLQAAIAGGRILSAEEITFSMKVRSMYEAGNEAAADWTSPANVPSDDTPEPEDVADEVADLSVGKSRGHSKSATSRRSQDIRASYYIKSPSELAGGIEDWTDLNGGDVDRHGFIVPRTHPDRPQSVGADGLHRVATGLRLAAEQPRRRGLRRTPSQSRSSRSLPPPGIRPSSLHSAGFAAGSTKSRRSVFRGKDRRITDAAGDMLTLPPGLADIAEDQDDATLRARDKRNDKWQAMARPVVDSLKSSGAGMQFTFDTSDPKVINRTWKGIPDRWRATAWHSFLAASARRRGKHTSDQDLIAEFNRVQDVNCPDDYQIDVDVPRTISMHIMFRRRYRGGQRLLFRVLHAIAVHFPDTGYVQGMASLAATLLCYYDEERAFVMMVRMWQLRGLEQLFRTGFDGLMAALKELEDNWLAGSDVAQKMNELAISSTAYGTRWYLTLFNMSIPFPAQLRVWDVFMLLGDAMPVGSGEFGGADLDVLHATSAALIDATREIILDSDFENAMKVLTSFVPIRDEDLLMRVTRTEWKMAKKRRGIS